MGIQKVSVVATLFMVVFSYHQLSAADTVLLSGFVRDLQGVSLSGFWISVMDEGNGTDLGGVFTDENGFYEFSVPRCPKFALSNTNWTQTGDYSFCQYLITWEYIIPGEASQVSKDLVARPAADIILSAYDHLGRLIRFADFDSKSWPIAHVTDMNSLPNFGCFKETHDSYSRDHGGGLDVALPSFLAPINSAVQLHVLWTVPGFGKVILDLDNEGQGYITPGKGEYILLNFNQEAAKSEVARLDRELTTFVQQQYQISEAVHSELAEAKNNLIQGTEFLNSTPPKMAEAVGKFDQALASALMGQELLHLNRAEANIPRFRKGTLLLSLKGEKGEPLVGAEVTYRQLTHDFQFGGAYSIQVVTDAGRKFNKELHITEQEITEVTIVCKEGVFYVIPSRQGGTAVIYLQ